LIKYKVANKYAKALFELSYEKKIVENVLKDLKTVVEMLKKSKDFKIVMIGAGISKDEKKEIIDAIAEKYSFSEISKSFLKLIIEKRKFKFLPYIFEVFQKKYREMIGVMTAEVISAIELDEKMISTLINKISEKLNKKIEVKQIVEPDIIGGIIFKTEGITYDASLKLQLNKIKENILKG
jgi:F-type H+-transporting ATPase subunit delta